MPRHLFLSFLGTNFYEEAIYTFPDGTAAASTRFVQLALLRRIRDELAGAPLQVRVFTTDKAVSDNWVPPGAVRAKFPTSPSVPYEGLEALLAADGFDFTHVAIPDGDDEAQHWAIFSALLGEVQQGDQLYVDITHGFRSLPVLLIKALDYLVQLRGVTVVRVEYGAWKPRVATHPIIDLTGLLVLDDWARAIHNVERGGDFLVLAGALKREIEPMKRALRGEASALLELPGAIKSLGQALEHCRLHQIAVQAARCVRHLHDSRDFLSDHPALTPLTPAIDQLIAIVRPMAADRTDRRACIRAQVHAARFLFERQRYLNGYTVLRESLVDVIEHHATDWRPEEPDKAKRRREIDARIYGAFARHAPRPALEAKPAPRAAGSPDAEVHQRPPPDPALEAFLAELMAQPWADAARQVIDPVNKLRNKLDHAGTSDAIPSPVRLADDAAKHIADTLALLDLAFPADPDPSEAPR